MIFLSLIVEEIPCATIYSTFVCSSSWTRPRFIASTTTAVAIECGKCSSKQAAIQSSSSGLLSSNGITSTTVGCALVSVPVLSNTIVSASATASKNLPPFTVISCALDSRIADSTDNGIANFNAQEKSTINTDNAFTVLRVNANVRPVPKNVYGTSRSAKCSALPSKDDLSFSESSIIVMIFSYLLDPVLSLTKRVISPSSTTVPA